jgi:hypothetical protein
MMSSVPERENIPKLIHEDRQNHPPLLTRFELVLFLSLTIFTAIADIGTVCFAMKQRYVDAFGNFSGSWFELIAISSMTLCAYFAVGLLWEKGHKRMAIGLYLVIPCLLALSLATTEASRFQAAWSGVHPSGESVFSGETGDNNASNEAPAWFLIGCDILFAFCLTIAGLLFIWSKRKLVKCLEDWKILKIGDGILAREEKRSERENGVCELEGLNTSLRSPELHQRIVRQVGSQAIKRYNGRVLDRRDQAIGVLNSVESSAAEKSRAQVIVEKAQECLAAVDHYAGFGFSKKAGSTVMVIPFLLVCFAFGLPARAQSTEELCRSAPVLQILIDASGSSPARDPGFISAVEPLVEKRLRSMPVCSQILIVSVGDASVMPIMLRTRIQMRTTRDGATIDEIVRGVQRFLHGLPDHIKAHEQARSELIGGFADASRNVNSNARLPNQIIVLSDLIENSTLANCEMRTCRLPDNPKLSLTNAVITVYGAGLGLPSSRAIALTKAWEVYLTRAGAVADLHRTF